MKRAPQGKPRTETTNGLQEAHCWPTNDPAVVGLELIDGKGKSFTAAINTSGVVSVIGKLLDVAVEPVFATASAFADGQPPQCHIDGTRLELASGRSPTEIAAKVTIGCIQMVVFLPLPEVLRATHALIQSIEPIPPGEGLPH